MSTSADSGYYVGIICATIAFCFLSCSDSGVNIDNRVVLARVGTNTIIYDDLRVVDEDPPETEQFIKKWVENQLLNQYGRKMGLKNVYEAGIISMKDVLGWRSVIEKTIDRNIFVSANEVREYYKNNNSTFKRNKDKARIFTVITRTEKSATDVVSSLKSEGVAAHATISQNHTAQVSIVSNGDLIPQLNSAIFLEKGRIVGPIKSDYGFHVCHILDLYKKGTVASLDESYDDIATILYLKKRETGYQSLIDSLASNTDIYINDALLEGNL